MKSTIVIVSIFISACAMTPKDVAWKTSLETPNPPGVNGNCLPVAQNLQEQYGGRIAVLSRGNTQHAVLMIEDERFLDNGTLGYGGHWDKVTEKGWKFSYWWSP